MKLVIFDVDGTLIDSQAHIMGAMERAFGALGLAMPDRQQVLGIVGLSLPEAMAVLAPDAGAKAQAALVEGYKSAFAEMRHSDPAARSPLYPGARDVLDTLAARDDILLAVATGKSRRGMAHVFDLHALNGVFHSVQTADDHPSKPHPSMIAACLADTGVEPAHAVMLGDTVYDMEMARAGGVTALGVDWGYHQPSALRAAGAADVVSDFAKALEWFDAHWGRS